MVERQHVKFHTAIVLTFLILVMFAAAANASEMRDIELTDGSVITGEIISLSNGTYTVRTESLGTVKIRESGIRAIRERGSASGDQEKSLKEKMVSDREIMGIIETLRNDPDFQAALRDPEIMKALQAGDISGLMANPKFMKLLDNKAIEQIKNKLSR